MPSPQEVFEGSIHMDRQYDWKTTWMSQEVSKRLGSVGYNPSIRLFISRWNNPFWKQIDPNFQRDIQVGGGFKYFLCSPILRGNDSHFDYFKWVETTP